MRVNVAQSGGRDGRAGGITRARRRSGDKPADTPECPRVGLSSGTQAEMQLVAEDHRPQGARPADLLVANVRSASATSATRGPTAARHSTAQRVPQTRTRSSARRCCRRWGRSVEIGAQICARRHVRRCPPPISRPGKIIDVGMVAGHDTRNASGRRDRHFDPIRVVGAARPAARDACPAPPVDRSGTFESSVSPL